jgi:hypothetical protein
VQVSWTFAKRDKQFFDLCRAAREKDKRQVFFEKTFNMFAYAIDRIP